jgi:UDP-glucuronate 4-epimerase
MSKILLTGCAGFIGSHVTGQLLAEGYEVIGLDNFNHYYNPVWKKQNIKEYKHEANFTFHQLDITDQEALAKIFKKQEKAGQKIDKILHLAARAGVRPSIKQPRLYQQVNVGGTLNLLELAREYKVPQFVFASSSSVYGNQKKVPFSESDPVNKPISPYAATKKAGEMLCHTYAHLYGIKTTCLRFFTVYGPAGRPDMAPYLFTKAIFNDETITKFGDGTSRRDYTYIDDIAQGVVAALETPFAFEIINLGNNTPVTLNNFLALLQQIIGKQAKIKQIAMQPGDVDQTYADISKAQELLEWQPETSFEQGLRQFVAWYERERLSQ